MNETNEMQETSSYKDFVVETLNPPPYCAFKSKQLIAQDNALAVVLTRSIKFKIYWLSVYIGQTLQRLYSKLYRLHLRSNYKEENKMNSLVMVDLASKFNSIASKIEILKRDI